MRFLLPLLGAGLIVFAVRDLFHTLLHPGGRGSLSEMLPRALWRIFRKLAKLSPSLLPLAGPSAFVAVFAAWIILSIVGWALIYWPYMPTEFIYASGVAPSASGGFIEAVYFSFTSLTTIGYGDIAPTSAWLRVLAPLEGLLGFALLTVAVSWVLALYPVLSRRRSLAHEIALLQSAEDMSGDSIIDIDGDNVAQVLGSLTTRLLIVRSDLIQFPITYYFHDGDERSSLATVLPYLKRLAEHDQIAGRSLATRLSAAVLNNAVNDFSSLIAMRFLGLQTTSTGEVLASYAKDHLHARVNPDTDVAG
jgi:hypothetical protein